MAHCSCWRPASAGDWRTIDYAIAPFIGVLLSVFIFRQIPGILFFIALGIMIVGAWMVNRDQLD